MRRIPVVLVGLCLLIMLLVHPVLAPAASTTTVHVQDDFFDSDSITINAGDSVLWVWGGANSHSTTSTSVPAGANGWDSHVKNSGTFGPLTFTVVGTYNYFCLVHTVNMTGTIKVLAVNVPTTTTLGAMPNPSVFGQPVTLTATVTANSGTPQGSVSFSDGTTALGTAALDTGGHAVLQVPLLSTGTHSLTAAYQGNPPFLASTSTAVSQMVNKATPAIGFSSLSNPSVVGGTVTFTVNVSSTAGLPSGMVSLAEGANPVGNSPQSLDANGNAAFMATLPVGSHALTVTYSGDANFNGGTAKLTQIVDQAPSTTTVATSANPVLVGTVTLTAIVTASAGGAPKGMVTFTDGATTLGSGMVTAGTATLMPSLSTTGAHMIQASYSGDTNHSGSSAQLVQIVNSASLAAATTLLSRSVFPMRVGQAAGTSGSLQAYTLTAAISSQTPGTPSGTVFFMDGANLIGSATVNASAKAILTTNGLTTGRRIILALYSGDITYAGNFSNAIIEDRTPRPH